MSKLERAYASIREDILVGRLVPGQRVVVEGIARDLDMSPVPVREAIRRLQSDGLLQVERNVGARVASLDAEQWEQAMHALALLDGYAFANAATGMTPEIIARARDVNQRMRDGLEEHLSSAEVLGLNRTFHAVIYTACENTFVVGLAARVWDRIDANRAIISMYGATRLRSAVDEHEQLLDDLTAGKSARVLEQAARQHNLNAIDAFRRSAGSATTASTAAGPPEPRPAGRGSG